MSLEEKMDIAQIVPKRPTTVAMMLFFGSIIFSFTATLTQQYLLGRYEAVSLIVFGKNQRPYDKFDPTSIISWCTLLSLMSQLSFILFYAYLCENHPPFAHADRFTNMDLFFFLFGIIVIASFFTARQNEQITSADSLNEELQKLLRDNDCHSQKQPDATSEIQNTSMPSPTMDVNADIHQDILIIKGKAKVHHNPKERLCLHGTETQSCMLHRNQTDEWKGWMQCAVLLYHYFHATDVYNEIRVIITCYIWITGFGHFSYFYNTKNYSIIRILRTIWRLNFLVTFTCLTMGTPYILYYSCPLHTFYFIMVYLTMRFRQHQNYSKYGLRIKLMFLAAFLYLIWDAQYLHLFEVLHFFIDTKPTQVATNGSLYEWYFRTFLDHWSSLLGMIFALNLPITNSFFSALEGRSLKDCWMRKGLITLLLFIIFILWIRQGLLLNKFDYNRIHAYFSFIPVTVYIFLRNISSTFRSHHLHLLSSLGQISLELYVLQHHAWLTSNSKTILTLIPGMPYLNILISTSIFVALSKRAHLITSAIRTMLLPENDHDTSIKHSLYLSIIVLFYVLVAFIIDILKINSCATVSILASIFGYIFYRCIRILTSLDSLAVDDVDLSNNNFHHRTRIFIAGSTSILLHGVIWFCLASLGSRPRTILQRSCGQFINNVHWLSIEKCSEISHVATHISNIGACEAGHIWGWEKAPPESNCIFRYRQKDEMYRVLKNRRLIFIGDSMMRSLYLSFARQFGIDDVIYGTLKKHSNITKTYKELVINFIWAPFAHDQIASLVELRTDLDYSLDLLVVGGGSWDLLHRTSNDAELVILNSTLVELKQEIVSIVKTGIPLVWLTPTHIYDPLLSEEKQLKMNEEKMRGMRLLYEEIGIPSAATLCIDGLAYTTERVSESFDGIHYPKSVYDVGAQILSNAFDWLFPHGDDFSQVDTSFVEIGILSSPLKGLFSMVVVTIGLYRFDSFMGLLYLASIFIQDIRPDKLYDS